MLNRDDINKGIYIYEIDRSFLLLSHWLSVLLKAENFSFLELSIRSLLFAEVKLFTLICGKIIASIYNIWD